MIIDMEKGTSETADTTTKEAVEVFLKMYRSIPDDTSLARILDAVLNLTAWVLIRGTWPDQKEAHRAIRDFSDDLRTAVEANWRNFELNVKKEPTP
jgi:hypothetical protein